MIVLPAKVDGADLAGNRAAFQLRVLVLQSVQSFDPEVPAISTCVAFKWPAI